jgi:DNA-binding CsgD family transcriptional regulator
LIAIHQGNFPEAEKLFVESLNRKHELAERLGVAYALEGLAYLAAASTNPQKAARLWGAAEAIRESIGTPLTDLEQADSERYITAARAQLREKAFQAEKETGAAMSLEQIFQYALEPSKESSQDAGKKTTRQSFPAGLTAREVEVLGLVAQGLSDAEVSESLVISPRTVNAHLTSIYNKLGVNSRVAATRFAVDHGLVEQ